MSFKTLPSIPLNRVDCPNSTLAALDQEYLAHLAAAQNFHLRALEAHNAGGAGAAWLEALCHTEQNAAMLCRVEGLFALALARKLVEDEDEVFTPGVVPS